MKSRTDNHKPVPRVAMAVTISAVWLIPFQIALGQVRPTEKPPALSGDKQLLETSTVPDWRVWRRFHSSLDSMSVASTGMAEAFLQETAGLSPAEANALLSAGRDYQRQLQVLGDNIRQEILTRFAPKDAPPLPDGVGPREVIQLPDGANLRAILEEEGFIDELHARRQALLNSHREYVAQLIGPTKLQLLNDYVVTVVAPSVKLVRPSRGASE